ncbi:bifunctional demethylmenaquinone methyltransferase/2-methoxy-6-polyprenyl-1,4-benzoquinol methylase UbiE [Bartonella sp. DGB2]|uniref:bifunctional demethylmenaquinone methyltransferase/2-methoxy-6-polyprenyl-1,4-benzoquinol methylase UbiE n=1 Tax=Bartonella sp. DGB2 TaxID=3388426 RepID=UPI00399021A7
MKRDEQRVKAKGGMETSFGFQEVNEDEKQARVDAVFHSVAEKYDKMNDAMSLGLHRVWKNALVTALNPPRYPNAQTSHPWHVLDVAGGTGDIAFRVIKASRKIAKASIVDINRSMLDIGQARAQKKGLGDYINFIEANAENLPFPENKFNAYTIAFGIRNVPHIEKALKEAFRVLRPGGRFLCLEFSQITIPGLEQVYDLWSFQAIPRLGKILVNDADSYQYLVESIRKFPNQYDFARLIEEAGFSRVSYRNLSGGIAALHSAWKI